MPSRLVLALFAAFALAGAAEAKPASSGAPMLILFSGSGFQGRQVFYNGHALQTVKPGFQAHSAVSSGIWTLCDGRSAASRCQTVDGAAARLKLDPRVVRAGVEAVALYDRPGLRGRRVIYSFASGSPPPFRVRSAKTWGGPWSLCPPREGACETIDGARTDLDLAVAAVRPGRAPERLQIAMGPPSASAPRPSPRGDGERPPPRAVAAPAPIPLPPLPDDFPRSAEAFAREPTAAAPAQPVQALPPPAPPRGPTQVDYACEDGRSLIVVFNPRDGTAEVLSQDEDPVVLDRIQAARGFRYESRDRAFFGERGVATYEDRDENPIDCRAVRPRPDYHQP